MKFVVLIRSGVSDLGRPDGSSGNSPDKLVVWPPIEAVGDDMYWL